RPCGGIVGAKVEARDALQVVDHVLAKRRIDGGALGDLRVHLLLDESSVKVAGVECDEFDFVHDWNRNSRAAVWPDPKRQRSRTSGRTWRGSSRRPACSCPARPRSSDRGGKRRRCGGPEV